MNNPFAILLAGKSLKELRFPENWKYNPYMFRWSSEDHVVKTTSVRTGETRKEYIYITDEMLIQVKHSAKKPGSKLILPD